MMKKIVVITLMTILGMGLLVGCGESKLDKWISETQASINEEKTEVTKFTIEKNSDSAGALVKVEYTGDLEELDLMDNYEWYDLEYSFVELSETFLKGMKGDGVELEDCNIELIFFVENEGKEEILVRINNDKVVYSWRE